jgi:hypothetical protein
MTNTFAAPRRRWFRYLGSSIACASGIYWFLLNLNPPPGPGLVGGPVMIVGALAYRSAKKRRLGEARSTRMRHVMEALAVLLIAASVVLQNDLKHALKTDPIPNLLVPAWCIVAYLIAAWRARMAER